MTPESALKFKDTPRYMKLVATCFSLGIALVLFIWSIFNYQPAPTIYGPRAIYSIIVLSLTLSLLGRYLLLRVIKRESGITHVLYQRLPPS